MVNNENMWILFLLLSVNSVNSTLNKNYFRPAHKLHLSKIRKFNLKQNTHVIHQGESNESYITDDYFFNDHFEKVRISNFYASDKLMFNSVWYPKKEYAMPILSVDMFYNINHGACLINLFQTNTKTDLTNYIQIKDKYPELIEKKTLHLMPFEPLLNNAYIYSHTHNVERFNTVLEIMDEYLNIYLKCCENSDLTNKDDLHETQKKYTEYNTIRNKIDTHFTPRLYLNEEHYKSIVNNYYNRDLQ